ncbi:MAG: RNA-splicing factor [Chaenotheca gracillima]|nr:MAG: RNA-splicing factor [Chaenotheca gracillima]
MEGFLLVPPERNSILGRALWKVRYVVLGPDPQPYPSVPSSPPPSSRPQSFRRQFSRNASVVKLEPAEPDTLWLSIYKRRGDPELVSRHPLAALRSCTVEDYSTRKGSVPLPTLVLSFESDGNRGKRRSSQSSGMSVKTRSDTLIFRGTPECPYAIIDWNRALQAHLHEQLQSQSPFLNSNYSLSDTSSRPSTSTTRPAVAHSPNSYGSNSSVTPQSALISPAVSFQSSYTATTSPSSTSPVRPTAPLDQLHSPTNSAFPDSLSTSPPGPKESILDRAFMMNCIPGHSRPTSGDSNVEEPMTSIARFEALMKELDARKAALSLDESPDEESVFPVPSNRKGSGTLSLSTVTTPTLSRPPRQRKSRPSSLAISPIDSKRSSVVFSGLGVGFPEPSAERQRSSTQSSLSTLTGGGAVVSSNNAGTMRRSITDFTWRLSSLGPPRDESTDDEHNTSQRESEQDEDPSLSTTTASSITDAEVDPHDGLVDLLPQEWRDSSARDFQFKDGGTHNIDDFGRRRRQGGVWEDQEFVTLI